MYIIKAKNIKKDMCLNMNIGYNYKKTSKVGILVLFYTYISNHKREEKDLVKVQY